MLTERQINRQTERRIVTITEVNVPERKVVARDEYGGTLPIGMFLTGDIVTVPAPGERWVAERHGNQFILSLRVADEIANLEPGDVQIKASGNVYIEGTEVLINGAEGGGGGGGASRAFSILMG